MRGPLSCLTEARFGICWGAVGAGRACYESALEYSKTRVQYGRPIAGFQLTQRKLVDMMLELQKAQLLAWRLGALKDAGELDPRQISIGKLNNVREALEVAREARTILGASRDHDRVSGDAPRQQPRVGADVRGHQRDPHADPRRGADRRAGADLTAPRVTARA